MSAKQHCATEYEYSYLPSSTVPLSVIAIVICCRIQVRRVQHWYDSKHGCHAWRILTCLFV